MTLDFSDDTLKVSTTSARGMLHGHVCSLILVGGALALSSTSADEPNTAWQDQYVHESPTSATHSSWALPRVDEQENDRSTASALVELRRISGLTWDQLGRIFGVSRRSVHFWASGKPLNATNEERLHRVLDVVRGADRGSASANRAALLAPVGGRVPLELLASQDFDDAREILGRGVPRRALHHDDMITPSKDARRPPRPETLIDALHDDPYVDVGRGRAARTTRNVRRGRGE